MTDRVSDGALQIEPFELSMAEGCGRILEALPEWFGIPDANAEFIRRLPELSTFVALVDDSVVGFIGLEQTYPGAVENHVLAVHPAHRGQGVGTALLRQAQEWCAAHHASYLFVKTLAPAVNYPPYAETRAFYLARGFCPLFETTALWGPENPAVVMVKALASPAEPAYSTGPAHEVG